MPTPRERVLKTFAGDSADQAPVAHIGFSSRAASHILGREVYVGGGIQQWREAGAWIRGAAAHQEFVERSLADAMALSGATGQDLLRWEYWRLSEKPTEQLDEHTFLFGRRDGEWRIRRMEPENETFPVIGQGGSPAQEPQNVEDLRYQVDRLAAQAEQWRPDDAAVSTLRMLRKNHGDLALRCHAGFVFIPFDQPLWLEASVVQPELVARYLRLHTRIEIQRIAAMTAAGAKLIFGGGDMASNQGPMYSPGVFHDLVLPCLRELAQACHRAGAYFLFASDGNLWPVADDLFGASGVDGYYEIDRRAGMDLNLLRDRFPRLTLVGGNISSQTLSRGSAAEVVAETRECLETAKARGRILVGLSNYAVPETPAANLHAMLETIARYR
ncbi:MAG: uroporphyrinogen decarboxylase family protein [Phycisphaerales bacterium]